MKTAMRQYIVAANRDRDRYDVPWALHASHRLARFATDLYFGQSRAQQALASAADLKRRSCPGLPSSKVSWCWSAIYEQTVRLKGAKTDVERIQVFQRIEKTLSEFAGRLSDRHGYDLLLYSGFALDAFRRVLDGPQARFVFVYHPLGLLTRKILVEDFERFGDFRSSHVRHMAEIEASEGSRYHEEVELAHGAICASAFTRRSILAAGMAPENIAVVPYGADIAPSGGEPISRGGKIRYLFVGQGVQRKGLHHLLHVWKAGGFAAWAQLDLVLNVSDPEVASAAGAGVNVLGRLTFEELKDLYANADVFVMPSLVEGFGLVYQEAISHGCRVVGGTNTGLPDLGLPAEACGIVDAGDRAALRVEMERLGAASREGGMSREEIRELATLRPRAVFRRELVQALEGFEAAFAENASAPRDQHTPALRP